MFWHQVLELAAYGMVAGLIGFFLAAIMCAAGRADERSERAADHPGHAVHVMIRGRVMRAISYGDSLRLKMSDLEEALGPSRWVGPDAERLEWERGRWP